MEHMWLYCPKVLAFWKEVIKWLETMTHQSIKIDNILLLFLLFTNENEKLNNKNLIEILIGVARIEIAQNWKDLKGLSFQKYMKKVWDVAVMEKLTMRARIMRGEVKKDHVLDVWYPLLHMEKKIGNELDDSLVYWIAQY